MGKNYTYMQQYEQGIIELREKGKTRKEICEIYGFTLKQLENFITRYNKKQRKLASGVVVHRKGRPPKDDKYPQTDTLNELRYIIARKEAKIKQLEMENELMRDFLSLTERK